MTKTFKVISGDWAGHEFFFVARRKQTVEGVNSFGTRAAFDVSQIVWM